MIDKLTVAVLEYQLRRKRVKKEDAFREIIDLSTGLIYMVMKYYYMGMFPKLIQEEIINECKSIILLKAVSSFDEERGARFSTHYVWKLKSYIRSKKEFYKRRYKVVTAISLNAQIAGGGESNVIALEDKLGTFKTATKVRVNREISRLFKE